jgi:superfamily I DNA and RNA helicase
MLTLLPSIPEYASDIPAQETWAFLNAALGENEGTCYYKHPAIRSATGLIPDFTLITRTFQPIVVKVLPWMINNIQKADDQSWTIDGSIIDSPIMELEDLVIALKANFERERSLRKILIPIPLLAMPLINRDSWPDAMTPLLQSVIVMWKDGTIGINGLKLSAKLDDDQWKIARAVLQGARPLSAASITMTSKSDCIGDSVRLLDKQIAILDQEQEKVAIPIAPGPQRIRGLAGTGKTVLLAMKAANIHLHYPNKKILFTFNTQSLYNQTRNLITRFFRFYADADPDWDFLHIRHAWGGRTKPGVYYDLSARQGIVPLNYSEARSINFRQAFQACCQAALSHPIKPEYDFILVDEAQDFPKDFFNILFQLTTNPHCIYWAYDELQNLFSLDLPRAEDLFGQNDDGSPNVSLEGEDYPGGIEKDLVLHRSYRCPPKTLLAAHAIGLGIYNKPGCVQMLQNRASWEAIGYIVESGELRKDESVVIYRPPENSPNPIEQLYSGKQPLVIVNTFDDREDELKWIADSIQNDIRFEKVLPDQIIVISLDAVMAKQYLVGIQRKLSTMGIASTIPGIIDDSAAFAEQGKVTLTSINRAKGNEAPIVYILSFESLYDFIAPIEGRNKAFTAISRSKAFVRITGVGKYMLDAKEELEQVQHNYPRFRFNFPDMEAIRRLDADTAKRRRAFESAKMSATELLKLEPEVLAALAKQNPDILNKLSKLLEEAKRESN